MSRVPSECDAMGGLAPVVELEPAGDGDAVYGDGEEDVPAPPAAVRLAGRVDIVQERDFCLAGLDVAQLVEDGYRLAFVRAEFEFHRVARSEREAASGHDGSRAGVGAKVYLVVGQVALLDAGDCSRRICRDVEFEGCHCDCPFVLCFVVVELEPASDGFSADSDGEKNVLAPPVSIGTLRAVIVYRKRDCRRDRDDVPNRAVGLREFGDEFAALVEFDLDGVALAHLQFHPRRDNRPAEVDFILRQIGVLLLDERYHSRRICRDAEFESCHCGCPFVLRQD